jgi:hypothetical protein
LHEKNNNVSILCINTLYGFEYFWGPRVGILSNIRIGENTKVPDENETIFYNFPRSVLGIAFEQRMKLGETENYLIFRENVLVDGIESEIINFTGSLFSFGLFFKNHIRASIGAGFNYWEEFPLQLLCSMGYEFDYRKIYIPVDLNILMPKNNSGLSFSVTVGLDFKI